MSFRFWPALNPHRQAAGIKVNDMTKPSVSYHYQITTHHLEVFGVDETPASAEQLYAALQDKNYQIRVSAALGLVRLGDHNPKVLDALFLAADWRSHPEAGSHARAGIVELAKSDPVLVDLLVAALKKEKSRLSGVAECLGEIGQATDAVISGLLYFSHRSKDSYAVISALHSLLKLGYQDEVLNTRLVRQYYRGDGLVQSVALQAMALVEQPPPEMIRLLRAVIQQGNQQLRYAVQALTQANLQNEQVEYDLIQASHSNDWETRDAAIQGLGMLIYPSPAAIDVLCNALADPKWFVRREAIASLGTLGRPDPKVIDDLLALLARERHKEHKQVAQTATNASVFEDERDIHAVLAELDASQSLRGDIAMTLAHLGTVTEQVIAAFEAELASDDASVRERIVRNWWLLGKRNPTLLAPLQAALNDDSEGVRTSAATSLQQIHKGIE